MENTSQAPTSPRQTTERFDTEEQHAFRLKAREFMAGNLPPARAGRARQCF